MERSRADVGPRHYGLEWLLENQPRWTAKEACPLTCGTLCGDDLDWTYTVEPMSCSGRNICGCDDKSFCDFKDRSRATAFSIMAKVMVRAATKYSRARSARPTTAA